MECVGLRTVSQWIGISLDEIVRMKDSGVGYIAHRFPLVEMRMTRLDCLAWFKENYPGRPLVRSSCVGCPFHSDAEWLHLANDCPDDMERAIALDERLRSPDRPQNPNTLRLPEYLHKSGKPLGEAIAKLQRDAADGQQMSWLKDAFGNECEGLCGV